MTAKQPYIERGCRHCGTKIPETVRVDAVYCSGTCRTKGNRIRDRAAYLKKKTEWHRARGRWMKHGLDPDKAILMLARGCNACSVPFESQDDAVVDHNHACCPGHVGCSKCVRGLLCRGCNSAIGFAKDDPIRLRALADYLEKEGEYG